MTSDHVTTARIGESMDTVRRLVMEQGAHAVPVLDLQGGLVGIVTALDLVDRTDPDADVVTVMSHDVVTIDPEADASAAAAILRERRIHHLVVVDADGRLAGMVTAWDLIAHLLDEVRSLTPAEGCER